MRVHAAKRSNEVDAVRISRMHEDRRATSRQASPAPRNAAALLFRASPQLASNVTARASTVLHITARQIPPRTSLAQIACYANSSDEFQRLIHPLPRLGFSSNIYAIDDGSQKLPVDTELQPELDALVRRAARREAKELPRCRLEVPDSQSGRPFALARVTDETIWQGLRKYDPLASPALLRYLINNRRTINPILVGHALTGRRLDSIAAAFHSSAKLASRAEPLPLSRDRLC